MKRTIGLLGALAAVTLGATGLLVPRHDPPAITASSHREAPLISTDPEADGTDFYMFIAPDRPDMITFVMSYNPLEAPDGGPNYYKFGEDVVYRLNVDNNHDAEEDIVYEWRFTTTTKNPGTFLYTTGQVDSIDDPDLNVVQTYTLTRTDRGSAPRVLAEHVPVAPNNVGKRSFPDYDKVAAQAIYEVPNTGGARIFAGPTDDAFWVDLRVFDLLQVSPAGQARDSLAGTNVHSIVLQAPITRFTAGGTRPTDTKAPNAVIGAWMSAHRPSMRVLNADGSTATHGELVQVSRLGHPLVNEVVAPRGAKDLFNASHPRDDAQFLRAVTDPELAALMNLVLSFPAPTSGRDDLVAVFLTGVPDLTKPNVANAKPSEMLRINLAVPPSANPNRMGVLGGDLAGFPNGRRLTDEVTDISLAAVGGVLKNVPGAASLSQGIPTNDVPFRHEFPYLAAPHSGNR